jgi:hypothetical protein
VDVTEAHDIQLSEKLFSQLGQEVRRAAAEASKEVLLDAGTRYDSLLASVTQLAQSAALSGVKQSDYLSLKNFVDDLQHRWKHQHETNTAELLSRLEITIKKSGIDLESKLDRKLDKRVTSCVDRKVTAQNEAGKPYHQFFHL